MLKKLLILGLCILAPLQAKWAGPDFILIGSPRTGTGSLYTYLCRHPQIVPAKKKEIHFFDDRKDSKNYRLGAKWYQNFFRLDHLTAGMITGEATPAYLASKQAPSRAEKFCPNAKLIVSLRNPVDRAFSIYKLYVRFGKETRSFEQALKDDDGSEVTPWKSQNMLKSQGIYLPHIKRWLKHFPKEQLHVMIMEDWVKNPDDAMQDLYAFLGLPPFHHSDYSNEKYNSDTSLTLSPKTKRELEAFYKPHNEALQKFLTEELGLDIVLPW